MRHCNSVFCAEDIWFLIDDDIHEKRRLFIASCPICEKQIALYSAVVKNKKDEYCEKYYYSNGAKKIKERLKKEISQTMLGFMKYSAPYGFKYGKNVEIRKKGKIIGIKQYSCDFYGNKTLVKKVYEKG